MNNPLTSTFRSSELSPVYHRELIIASVGFNSPVNKKLGNLKPSKGVVMARKNKLMETLGDEMNKIGLKNLDSAPSRRLLRSAFVDVHQNLDHCLFQMAPPGIRTEEWYEINSKDQEIFCKSWLPKIDVRLKGVLCFCHGYGDTCTFFFDGIAKQIASNGYAVYAIDHPGFGLSEGLHGYVSRFDDMVDNVIEQFTIIKGRPELQGLPHFLLGQSMGGAIAIKALLKEPHKWDGLVLVAPMCKIAEEVMPPALIANAFTMLANILPKAKLVPKPDLAELAFRDLNKRNMASYNMLCYNERTRLRTAVELIKATNDIESKVEKIYSPLLILHGAADRITDPKISEFLYEKASSNDKTLKLYEDGYHCILEGEPDERIFTVLEDIITWLDSRCSVRNKFLFNVAKGLAS